MGGQEALRRKLDRARVRNTEIEIVRRPKAADSISGFVVGVGEHWVLVFVDNCGSPDGYEVVRLSDIKRVDKRVDDSSGHLHCFLRRSLKRHGAWPPPAPETPVDLDGSARELIESVSAAASLVTIFVDDSSLCYIGRPASWGARKLRFHEVNPCGDWDKEIYSYRIDSISRVNFGGIYNTNLAAVAGPEPDL